MFLFLSISYPLFARLFAPFRLNYITLVTAAVTIPFMAAFCGPIPRLATLMGIIIWKLARREYALGNLSAALWASVLFAAHADGAHAIWYVLYWIIPALLLFITSTNQLFLRLVRAVNATMGAHAIGTLVFMYSGLATPDLWNALVLIVWRERLVLAALLVFVDMCAHYVVDPFILPSAREEAWCPTTLH